MRLAERRPHKPTRSSLVHISHLGAMSGFYERLSQEQSKQINALRTQITGLNAQVASLTAQVAAQERHIRLLEQPRGEQPSSSNTNDRRLPAVKREWIEDGLPAEDFAEPVTGLGAALVSGDTDCFSPTNIQDANRVSVQHEHKVEDFDMADAQPSNGVVSEDIPGDVARVADAVDLPRATSNAASVIDSAEIEQDIMKLAETNVLKSHSASGIIISD